LGSGLLKHSAAQSPQTKLRPICSQNYDAAFVELKKNFCFSVNTSHYFLRGASAIYVERQG
jgi:hypothetical protein